MPFLTMRNRSSVSLAARTDGLISHATPKPGRGLIRADTHRARASAGHDQPSKSQRICKMKDERADTVHQVIGVRAKDFDLELMLR